MMILGIAGTAKNTGKTTTLVEVMKYFCNMTSPERLFLTSIGYDGEDFDNITGLPKPRIEVPAGVLVASALPLLKASSADFVDLVDTNVRTSLGRLFIGRAARKGKVVLAGPTSTTALARVLRFCQEDSTVLLDGAFSRLSPMVLADYVILATGAARNKDSLKLAREMEVIAQVMNLPLLSGDGNQFDLIVDSGLFLKGQGGDLGWRICGAEKKRQKILVRGIINPQVFEETLSVMTQDRKGHFGSCDRGTFVFHHPISMLLSGDITKWKSIMETMGRMGYDVEVEKRSKLLGFTINPYVPEFQPSGRFIATYMPPRVFLEDIRALTSAPCTDIVLEGPGIVYSWLSSILPG